MGIKHEDFTEAQRILNEIGDRGGNPQAVLEALKLVELKKVYEELCAINDKMEIEKEDRESFQQKLVEKLDQVINRD